jgi:hypothetical protein
MLQQALPRFFGLFEGTLGACDKECAKTEKFLILEHLLAEFTSPYVMDCKLGTRSYEAVRCLLVVRRLQLELEAISQKPCTDDEGLQPATDDVPGALEVPAMPAPLVPPPEASGHSLKNGADDAHSQPEEEFLLKLAEEAADSFQEGRSFELGRQDRIVCGVVTHEGRHTRYLMLHPFFLLLVQPDLQKIGLAVVRTLCPVRQVEPMIDRTDPRTLKLGIRLPKGAHCPGEASTYEPAGTDGGPRLPAEEQRGSAFFMLTLSFEDVKRCLCADQHLRKCRQEVREQLRARVENFIERLCK